MGQSASIGIIIPVLNEAGQLDRLGADIHRQVERSNVVVVIVDGGSNDGTPEHLSSAGFPVISAAEKGRAAQMNTGWRAIDADCYWFLHADCIPHENAINDIRNTLASGMRWGRFDVKLTGKNPLFRIIEWMMNWRSCLTRVATGDQGIFVRADLLKEIGGIPAIPLMEDIALSKRLRRYDKGCCIKSRMTVSSRRWEKSGIIHMTLLMWWLRLQYFLGADPARLYRRYYEKSA